MKFGMAMIPHWPEKDVLEMIQLAEDLGYNNAWLTDQTFFSDPMVLLAVAGLRSKKIQLGIGVTNPYTRTAYQVARSIATIGDVIERPVILGVGAGNRKELILPLGMEQTSPTARIEEMFLLVRRLLAGETVTYQSEWTTLKGVSLKFKPTQPVDMFIAARGPATMRLGGEVCDGVIIGDLISDAGLDYAQGEIERGLAKAKRNRKQVEEVCWTTCFITDGDNEVAVDKIRPWVAHNLAASPPVVQKALGMDDERIKLMRDTYQKGGAEAAAHYVTAADADKLSIIGPPERCVSTIRRLKERGIGQLSLLMFSKVLDENKLLLKRFAEEVMPFI